MAKDETPAPFEGERIAKAMARAGLCSRRDAEAWIGAGRVSVNGKVIDSPALNVTDKDRVSVDGQPMAAKERTRLWLYHKPKGLVTTTRDPDGRATIFESLPSDLPRVMTIGRLDINTEGLLLLTNDGGLARLIELPQTGWLRRYRVRAHGEVMPNALEALKDGITLDGIEYRGIEAKMDRQQGANTWLTMGLREGKNREIKRVLEHLGLAVNRLIRLSFGPFELRDIEIGAVVEVPTRILIDQLGPRLAQEAGADFSGPLTEVETREARWARSKETRAPEPGGERPRGKGPRAFAAPQRDFLVGAPAPDEVVRRDDRPAGPVRRQHISASREDARKHTATERIRTVRSDTQDRKGRKVAVERFARVDKPEPEKKPARRGKGRAARVGEGRTESAPSREAASRFKEAAAGAPGKRTYKPREGAGERPARKPFSRDGAAAAPRSRDRAEGGRGGPTFKPRAGAAEGRPAGRFSRSDKGPPRSGERTFKPRGGAPRSGETSSGPPRGDKPFRSREGGPPRGKPGGSFGGKPRSGGKPSGAPRGPRAR